MKLLFAIAADEIKTRDGEGTYDAIGLSHTIVSDEFPFTRKIHLYVVFRADIEDQFQDFGLEFEWHGDGIEEPFRVTTNIPMPNEGWHHISPIVEGHVPIIPTFPGPGRYYFDVILGGQTVGTINLEAIEPYSTGTP